MGVLLYVLVLCTYPFGYDGAGGDPTGKVLLKIKEGKFTFPVSTTVPLAPLPHARRNVCFAQKTRLILSLSIQLFPTCLAGLSRVDAGARAPDQGHAHGEPGGACDAGFLSIQCVCVFSSSRCAYSYFFAARAVCNIPTKSGPPPPVRTNLGATLQQIIDHPWYNGPGVAEGAEAAAAAGHMAEHEPAAGGCAAGLEPAPPPNRREAVCVCHGGFRCCCRYY